jgi:prepilin-type N-terminal cleavage/methylation domain-containing protein
LPGGGRPPLSSGQGFTLAEVLITLGIIGVVAALTMPALISNHRKNVTLTKLKKVYSVMNQAYGLAVVENGDFENWAMDVNNEGDPFQPSLLQPSLDWYNTYLAKHIQAKIAPGNDENNKPLVVIYFADGSLLTCRMGFTTCIFYLDQKAYENSKDGTNHFSFYGGRAAKVYFEPYAYQWDGTREDLMSEKPWMGCNANTDGHAYCAKLIQYDGWEISDDYPFKF